MIHTFSLAFTDDENTSATVYASTQSGDGQTNIDVLIPSGQSNYPVAVNIDISEVKGVLINSDIDATLLFKYGGATVQTMVFSGNKPLLWQAGFPNTNPITGDFTGVIVSSTTGEMKLKAFFLQNV